MSKYTVEYGDERDMDTRSFRTWVGAWWFARKCKRLVSVVFIGIHRHGKMISSWCWYDTPEAESAVTFTDVDPDDVPDDMPF